MSEVHLVEDKIKNLIEPFFEQSGLDLVELNCRRQGKDYAILILADRPNGGITIEECARLNHSISGVLEEQQKLMEQNYSLEVSSPGIDRPLKSFKDFKRVVNAEIRFFLTSPLEGKWEHWGVLKEVHEDSLVVDTSNNPTMIILLSQINKGLQIIE